MRVILDFLELKGGFWGSLLGIAKGLLGETIGAKKSAELASNVLFRSAIRGGTINRSPSIAWNPLSYSPCIGTPKKEPGFPEPPRFSLSPTTVPTQRAPGIQVGAGVKTRTLFNKMEINSIYMYAYIYICMYA